MTWLSLIAVSLPLAAAANALLLATALAHRAMVRRVWGGLYGSGFLLVAAAAVATITLDHSGLLTDETIAAFIEGALTLSSGPFLVLFTGALLGLRSDARLLFAPLFLYAISAAALPGLLAHAFAVERLVFVQMAYTAFAGARAYRFRAAGRRGETQRRLALAIIGAVCLVHLAQLVRMFWSDVTALINIVPMMGAIGFLGAAAAIYFSSRVSALEPPERSHAQGEALAAGLDRLLDDPKILRDPGLGLPHAASLLGARPAELSRALAAVHGKSFVECLQTRRVEEAKRLLADPQEARTSMEAVGLLAGFGSRSAFYKVFREHAGVTPAAFRSQSVQKSCPES